MARPGTLYTSRDAAPPRTAPTDTGTLFVADVAASGPTDAPVLIETPTKLREVLGADIPQTSTAADLELAFRIGIRRVYFIRLDVADPAAVTDADRIAALDKFPRRLGAGQIVLPGVTSAAAQKAVIAHGAANNRTPFLDLPRRQAGESDADYRDVLIDAVAAHRADVAVSEELGAAFAGTVMVPGKIPGTERAMSDALAAAALVARQDAATSNPNAPAAGEAGYVDLALRVREHFTDADREALNAAGVNLFTDDDGVQLYGFRTLADPAVKPRHWMLSNVRLDMAVRAKADAIAKRHVFKIIDSEGDELSAYGGELTSMLGEYKRLKAIFSKDGDEGFRVDVGDGVNSLETIADGRIRAVLVYRRAPFGEVVEVEHVVVGVTEGL